MQQPFHCFKQLESEALFWLLDPLQLGSGRQDLLGLGCIAEDNGEGPCPKRLETLISQSLMSSRLSQAGAMLGFVIICTDHVQYTSFGGCDDISLLVLVLSFAASLDG